MEKIFFKLTNQKQEFPRLWWPCLLMDQDEMSNPCIDVSYQVLVHLAMGVSEEKIKM